MLENRVKALQKYNDYLRGERKKDAQLIDTQTLYIEKLERALAYEKSI